MKKITLLLLFSASFSFSQVLITENFESGLSVPASWTNTEITSLGNIWEFQTGGFAKYLGDSNTAFYSEGGFSGNYAIFDSDGFGGGPEEAALISPIFNCTGLTNIKITFNHLFVSGFGGEAYVEVYNGTSWIEIINYTEANVEGNTFIAGAVILDVSTELADVTNAQIRFRWVGNNSYYWGIDDISVQQPTIPAPNPTTTPNPVNGATNVVLALDTDYNEDLVINSDDAAYTFSWSPAVDGEVPDGYEFYLGQTSPPAFLTTTSNTSFTLFGLEYSTTYYWAIVAYNITGGAEGTSIWSFTTEADPSLSVEDNNLNVVRVFPNPVIDILNIDTNEIIDEISISNQLGQRVLQINKDRIYKNSIDLSSLSKGIYLMTVKSNTKSQTVKILKN